MPFSPFRGGLKPPLHCSGGFTLHGFAVNGFIPPVDGPRMSVPASPLQCTLTRNARASALESALAKLLNLKSPGMNTYKKRGEGGIVTDSSLAPRAHLGRPRPLEFFRAPE